MSDNTYNGYTNYETWAVALWIDNEQSSYQYWRDIAQECWDDATDTNVYFPITRERNAIRALADRLKEEHEESMPELDGIWSDLLTSALGEVDWNDIAENWIADVDKTEEPDDENDDDSEDD